MRKYKRKFEEKKIEYNAVLSKVINDHETINEDSIFEKSHLEIAKMIPEYGDLTVEQMQAGCTHRDNFCDAVIGLFEANIEYLYEEYTYNDFNYKHKRIVSITLLVSGVFAYFLGVPAALISASVAYFVLSNRETKRSVESMSWHEWHKDSIAGIKRELDKLEKLRWKK